MISTIQLNPQQALVAETLDRHFLLLAPAGTGKTNTLSARIAAIIASGKALPEEILCLTFTNRACREMLERVESVVGAAAAGITVRTVHSFCYHLLLEYGPLTGEKPSAMGICDEEDSAEIIGEVLAGVPGVEKIDPARVRSMIRALASFMEMVKHQMYREKTRDIPLAAAQVLEREGEFLKTTVCVDNYTPDPKFFRFLATKGAALMESYQRLLLERSLYDFHDLVLQAGLLLEHPAVSALVHQRYRYIHIDEVQDISDIEYSILTRMAPEAVFLLCGDVNQTIYSWRGSVPQQILPRFQRDFSPQEVRLEVNYRSSPGLVNLGERIAAHAFSHTTSPPVSYTRQEVAVAALKTQQEQIQWMFDRLITLNLQGDYSRVAILCRSNALCAAIAKGFAQCQKNHTGEPVRFMLAEEFRLFRTKEVKDLLAFMRAVLIPQEDTALGRIVLEYAPGIGGTTLEAIRRQREGMGIRLSDYLSPVTHAHGDYLEPLTQALDAGNVVVFDVESTGVDVYQDEIIQFAAIRTNSTAQTLESLERYLRPEKPVGASFAVHGLSDAFLAKEGLSPKEGLAELTAFLQGKIVVGHNVGYDLSILEAQLRRYGLPPLEIAGVYDTLELSRRYLPELPNHKLATVSAYFESAAKPSHDAMDDILATAQVLAGLASRFILPQETARRSAFGEYLARFLPLTDALILLREEATQTDIPGLCAYVMETFDFAGKYAKEPSRLENLGRFCRFMADPMFDQGWWKQSLSLVLEYATLSSSELDRLSKSSRKLSIITIHQAKGCEFDTVFLPSMMENRFPGVVALRSGTLEEEARLFYVAATRAKKRLFLSWYKTNENSGASMKASRFLDLL
ncbi:ATP-dependent helicase [Oscillospiraceae bacterium MB08-C2-2]|nr:ATP-dependent helicase [Oscillospiraceae bacterium MB08-C2-2]